MSLWLQAAIQALSAGNYEKFRTRLLPRAPFRVPDCLFREFEFAERRCRHKEKDQLFPIRFLWLMEAKEQRMFGLGPLARSRYHPEILLELWKQVSADPRYRQEMEAQGFRFDLEEKAMDMSVGWVYIGDRFVEDFLEVESVLGVELLFPDPSAAEGRPAFRQFKHPGSGEVSPA